MTPVILARRSFNSKALFGTKNWINSKKIERVSKNKKLLINFLSTRFQIIPKKE